MVCFYDKSWLDLGLHRVYYRMVLCITFPWATVCKKKTVVVLWFLVSTVGKFHYVILEIACLHLKNWSECLKIYIESNFFMELYISYSQPVKETISCQGILFFWGMMPCYWTVGS